MRFAGIDIGGERHAVAVVDEGGAVHVQFADPYCPVGRARAMAAATDSGWAPVPSGTLVIIEGPRFSTRAESQWYAAQGWTLIGMTGHPEAVLARELALCYSTLALVTDTDAHLIVVGKPGPANEKLHAQLSLGDRARFIASR